MSQESGTDAKGASGIAAAFNTVLADAEAEPIPEVLIQLAQKLEDAISDQAADHSQDRGSQRNAGNPLR